MNRARRAVFSRAAYFPRNVRGRIFSRRIGAGKCTFLARTRKATKRSAQACRLSAPQRCTNIAALRQIYFVQLLSSGTHRAMIYDKTVFSAARETVQCEKCDIRAIRESPLRHDFGYIVGAIHESPVYRIFCTALSRVPHNINFCHYRCAMRAR